MIRRRALLDDHRLTEREQKSLSLLELIRQRGPLTRTELSQGTGFNIVTVSNYVAEFITRGLVVERGFDISTGGRKPVLVELNAKAGFAVGVDVGPADGGVPMTGVITDLRGNLVHRLVRPRAASTMDRILEEAGAFLRELLRTSPVDAQKIQGVGIGVRGILDERAGTVREISQRGVRTSYVAQRDRWETELHMPVLIGNDAALAGYGEYRLGLDHPVENMVYLYSDVGASLILHGHVYWGSSGSAGTVGVQVTSADDYLAWVNSPAFVLSNVWDLGLTAQAKKLIEQGNPTAMTALIEGEGREAVTMDMVIRAAQGNDPLAKELIEHSALQLGIRIASIVNLLNPEVVVIGGGIERAGSLLLEPVWRAVKRYAYEEPSSLVDVLPAKLGENAVALGAASWIVREIFIQS